MYGALATPPGTVVDAKFLQPLLSKNSEVGAEAQLGNRRLRIQCQPFSFTCSFTPHIFTELLYDAMCWPLRVSPRACSHVALLLRPGVAAGMPVSHREAFCRKSGSLPDRGLGTGDCGEKEQAVQRQAKGTGIGEMGEVGQMRCERGGCGPSGEEGPSRSEDGASRSVSIRLLLLLLWMLLLLPLLLLLPVTIFWHHLLLTNH